MGCALAGFDDHECGGRLHLHHIINRGKFRGNTPARIYCEELPRIFLIEVCEWHNVMRWADSKQARKYLFLLKIKEYGEDKVRIAIDGIPWKIPHHELGFQGIMSIDIGT